MILVDYRRGSGTAARSKSGEFTDIINYPPLNTCTTCGKPFHLANNEWRCSSGDPSHTAPTVITHLNSADLAIPGNGPAGPLLIGVEVKSLSDLISSCDTGRLQARQLPEMRRDYHVAYLLYYGAYRCNPTADTLQVICNGKWADYAPGSSKRYASYLGFESMLLTLSCAGLRIKHIAHARKPDALAECARWVAALARWWGKPWHEHEGLKRFDESGYDAHSGAATLFPEERDEAENLCAEMASRIPGIRYKRGWATVEHFDSIVDMVCASEEKWATMKIGGKRLGPVLAKATVELMRRKFKRKATDAKK